MKRIAIAFGLVIAISAALAGACFGEAKAVTKYRVFMKNEDVFIADKVSAPSKGFITVSQLTKYGMMETSYPQEMVQKVEPFAVTIKKGVSKQRRPARKKERLRKPQTQNLTKYRIPRTRRSKKKQRDLTSQDPDYWARKSLSYYHENRPRHGAEFAMRDTAVNFVPKKRPWAWARLLADKEREAIEDFVRRRDLPVRSVSEIKGSWSDFPYELGKDFTHKEYGLGRKILTKLRKMVTDKLRFPP